MIRSAGKQIADATSFKEAIFMAIDVYKNRQLYAEISANPLVVTQMKKERE